MSERASGRAREREGVEIRSPAYALCSFIECGYDTSLVELVQALPLSDVSEWLAAEHR